MIVIFARNNHWISKLVRWRTNSQWSHVGIIDECGKYVIEAVGSKGVRRTSLENFKSRYTATATRYLKGDINRAKAKIGQDFDLWGLWGIFFRWRIHDPNAWFCSELVALASHTFNDEIADKVTPEHIWWHAKRLPQE